MLTLVIAHSNEDLVWTRSLPSDVRLLVYSEGTRPVHVPSHARFVELPRGTRAAGAYLHHLALNGAGQVDGHTVFLPGNAPDHAPQLAELLADAAGWRDVQPLSLRGDRTACPPARLLEGDRRDWLGNLAIRAERYGLATLAPRAWVDHDAAALADAYRERHGLEDGENLIAHLLDLCGLEALARDAATADGGVHAHGGLFAVHNATLRAALQRFEPEALARMVLLTRAEPSYGVLFERLWLHLFGEPFQRDAALGAMASSVAKLGLPAALTVAVAARPETAAVANSKAPAAAVADSGLEILRRLAFDAQANGRHEQATAALKKALLIEPMNVELLADVATLHLQAGEFPRAIAYARRALVVEPDHAIGAFVLATSLAAVGKQAEALPFFEALVQGPRADALRAEDAALQAVAERQYLLLRQAVAA